MGPAIPAFSPLRGSQLSSFSASSPVSLVQRMGSLTHIEGDIL